MMLNFFNFNRILDLRRKFKIIMEDIQLTLDFIVRILLKTQPEDAIPVSSLCSATTSRLIYWLCDARLVSATKLDKDKQAITSFITTLKSLPPNQATFFAFHTPYHKFGLVCGASGTLMILHSNKEMVRTGAVQFTLHEYLRSDTTTQFANDVELKKFIKKFILAIEDNDDAHQNFFNEYFGIRFIRGARKEFGFCYYPVVIIPSLISRVLRCDSTR
jgi:hypothetical protein